MTICSAAMHPRAITWSVRVTASRYGQRSSQATKPPTAALSVTSAITGPPGQNRDIVEAAFWPDCVVICASAAAVLRAPQTRGAEAARIVLFCCGCTGRRRRPMLANRDSLLRVCRRSALSAPGSPCTAPCRTQGPGRTAVPSWLGRGTTKSRGRSPADVQLHEGQGRPGAPSGS